LTAGSDAEDFSISFTLSGIPEIEHFVGRKEELNKIRQIFRGDGSHREIIVLWGLGGIGKTQLAVRFTKQLRDTYSAIFWLNGKNEQMVKQSFVKMAKRLYHNYPSSTLWKTAAEAKDVNQIVEAIKRWLSAKNNTRWLLVFDGVDNPQAYDIRSYFPEAHQGFILITTRSSRLRIGKVIHIEKFREIEESIMTLAHMSGRKISDQGRHQIEDSTCRLHG
jgi:NB-ARC domain